MHRFEPTSQAARARLAAVWPDAYAQTRNALDGAVTGLSPYITHGLLSLRHVYADVHARYPLDAKHKFVFELGWRSFYRHVWAHMGEDIHKSLQPGLLPDDAYRTELPMDVVEARTGIAAIDLAVHELYATGYVHNHARMFLASYVVHLRKVHWHTAAQWMLGHLLDGDVAKFAPANWHSPGTVIDASYESLDGIARSATEVDHAISNRLAGAGMPQPPLMVEPSDAGWSAPEPNIVD